MFHFFRIFYFDFFVQGINLILQIGRYIYIFFQIKQRVSCGNELDSEIRRDRCGVCGGDSSTCKFVRKKWEEKCPGFGKLSDNINRFLLRPKLIS